MSFREEHWTLGSLLGPRTPEHQTADVLVASAADSVPPAVSVEPRAKVCVLMSFLSCAWDVIAASDPGFWEKTFYHVYLDAAPEYPSRCSRFSHQLYFYSKYFWNNPCVQPLPRILVRKYLKYVQLILIPLPNKLVPEKSVKPSRILNDDGIFLSL